MSLKSDIDWNDAERKSCADGFMSNKKPRPNKQTSFDKLDTGYIGYDINKACHETHPPLPINDYVIYGGSGNRPKVPNCDIYIGFDSGINVEYIPPWKGRIIYFPIPDMGVPDKGVKATFDLIKWVSDQLKAGKKIHCGCIGGHGRTGLFFSILVNHMLKIKDSTTYVRENYCKKTVESQGQINWLYQNFGITKVKPTKGYLGDYMPAGSNYKSSSKNGKSVAKSPYPKSKKAPPTKTTLLKVAPLLSSSLNIWGESQLQEDIPETTVVIKG